MTTLSSDLLTVPETAKMLRISQPTLFLMIRDSQIPTLKIAGRRLFRRSSLNTWLDDLETKKRGAK